MEGGIVKTQNIEVRVRAEDTTKCHSDCRFNINDDYCSLFDKGIQAGRVIRCMSSADDLEKYVPIADPEDKKLCSPECPFKKEKDKWCLKYHKELTEIGYEDYLLRTEDCYIEY